MGPMTAPGSEYVAAALYPCPVRVIDTDYQ